MAIEDVAARFGVSPLVVRRRLKLASLSPRLIALYRDEGINLDQLMALTLTDDHEKELRRQSAAMLTADEFQSDGAECIHLELDDIEARRKAIRDTLASWSSDALASAAPS